MMVLFSVFLPSICSESDRQRFLPCQNTVYTQDLLYMSYINDLTKILLYLKGIFNFASTSLKTLGKIFINNFIILNDISNIFNI